MQPALGLRININPLSLHLFMASATTPVSNGKPPARSGCLRFPLVIHAFVSSLKTTHPISQTHNSCCFLRSHLLINASDIGITYLLFCLNQQNLFLEERREKTKKILRRRDLAN
ncbi:hypothetical protein FRB91_001311 [Serendipita sp. 411]|nr:hypothetical protein FRB91_001311 [Serendipita sp. 411]